ncbi:chaperonin 10-like protein [Flammula alnicola]|nr:chaperonin 10-like protein [Flammula alnicola]
MPSTQKALLLDKKFGSFALGEIEVNKPGPGEILIKVQAAALNPVDWKIQKYGVLVEEFPAVLGSDIAGDVEDIGEGVTDFTKGDRVFGQGQFTKDGGGFQQYVVCLAATTSKIPPNFSYDNVFTLPMALTTAYVGIYSETLGLAISPPTSEETQGKYTGIPFVVLGGSGSVGQMAIQLAKLSGFSPIITTASQKHADFLKSLGASHVLDRSLPAASLYVYDSISSEDTQRVGLDLLSPGGQLTLVLPSVVKPTEDKRLAQAFAGLRVESNIQLLETFIMIKSLDFWKMASSRVEVLPDGLAGISEGLARLEADQVSRLKLVAHPQESA